MSDRDIKTERAPSKVIPLATQRVGASRYHLKTLDPVQILNRLADECTRDAGFWICTSAAAYLNGYDLQDGDGSTVACYFPDNGGAR